MKRSDAVGTYFQLQQRVWKQKAAVSQSRDLGREEQGGESTHLLELSAACEAPQGLSQRGCLGGRLEGEPDGCSCLQEG